MDERVRVDAFQRGGERKCVINATATSFGCGETKNRSQSHLRLQFISPPSHLLRINRNLSFYPSELSPTTPCLEPSTRFRSHRSKTSFHLQDRSQRRTRSSLRKTRWSGGFVRARKCRLLRSHVQLVSADQR